MFPGRIFKALKVRKTKNLENDYTRKKDSSGNPSNVLNRNLIGEDNNKFVVVQV